MVNTLIYDLLKFSANKESYEKLFDISLRKRKILDGEFDEINLLTVCDELLKETRKKNTFKQNQKMFYLTSQLTFGALYFYKWKTENLLLRVKAAMLNCSFNFGDPLLSFSQYSTETSKQSRKGVKRKHFNPFEDYNLLDDEDQPQDQNFQFKKPFDVKKKKVEVVDQTLVSDIASITLMETLPATQSAMSIINNHGDDEDGFGDEDFNDYLFEDPSQSFQPSGSVGFISQQDESVRVMDSQNPTNVISVIAEVHSQTASVSMDDQQMPIDHDLGLPDIIRHNKSVNTGDFDVIESFPFDENNNNVTAGNAFNMDENHPPKLPEIQESNMTMDSNNCSHFQIPDISIIPNVANEEIVEMNVNANRQSKKAKKRGLIIDEVTMIPAKKMQMQLDCYDDLMIEKPLDTFAIRMFEIKTNIQNLFAHPLRQNISEDLLLLYKRNIITKKRGRIAANTPKNKTREDTTVAPNILEIPTNSFAVLNDITNVNNFTVIPDILDNAKNSEMSTASSQRKPSSKRVGVTRRGVGGGEYNEKDKWSREKILKTLENFWSTGQTPVNLEMLNIRNRFVFAGVFFELLTLKKLNVIELVQSENDLTIGDIKKGRYFHKKY